MLTQKDLFITCQGDYNTYRIPALVTSTRGTVFAFCEGRRNSSSDSGDIDILLRRSFDSGQTWEDFQVVATNGSDTAGNPAPVVDRETGTVWLLFCHNLAEGNETKICRGEAPRTVWVTKSDDDGETWSEPRDITEEVKQQDWTWYATGPCHGIQLESGRLVIPCDHIVGEDLDRSTDPYHSHVIYSDDHGSTWEIGGIVEEGTNESVVVQTVDGRLYINCRNYHREKNTRAFAWSEDEGETFSDLKWDDALIEPICQASLVRFTDEKQHDRNRIVFSNPASQNRERMTLRLSYDECVSWSEGKVLYPGPAAYSDLVVMEDMTLGCLYECGEEGPYEKLVFAKLDLQWLEQT